MTETKAFYLLQYILISIAVIYCVACQGSADPCDDAENVIQLPGARKCLSYRNDAKHWVEAASICEREGGTLYRIDEGQLGAGSGLKQCLLSTPDTGGKLDFWIGATSVWSPQWTWVNGSYLNPLLACTQNYSALTVPSFDVCSNHLSVDYCVSICRQEGAPFSVIEHKKGRKHPCCWCSYQFDARVIGDCPNRNYTRGPSEWLSVFSSFPRFGTAIVLKSSEALSQTETLCARVNLDTTTIRELSSQSCFTRNYYLCNLGNKTDCTLTLGGQCVFVGQTWVTWFAARADCRRRGGDLLIVGELVDMYEIIPYIKLKKNYWIGAFNHVWDFQPGSDVFRRVNNYVAQETSCGHLYNEGNTWLWSDTSCDSRKPFYCQFDSVKYANVPASDNDYICPWDINPPTPVIPTDLPLTRSVVYSNVSTTPTQPGAIVGDDSSSFPLAAVIAACVAGFLMLLCVLLSAFFVRRRQWLAKKFSRKSDRVFGGHRLPRRFYHRWSNAYNYYPDQLSDGGWESVSTHHTGVLSDMSVVSAPSPGGYVREGYENRGLTRAYTLASPADLDALYANINNKGGIIRRSNTKASGHSFTTVGHALGSGIAATSGIGGSGTDIRLQQDLDKTLTSIHHTGSPTSKEYMTLAAHMNIFEDLGSTRSATRTRPEVALVTNDVDLNFTVNRAITKNRTGSEHSSERTIEEIELPVGTTVEIPTNSSDFVHF
ncbi:uncharacterized protein [Haliotis cracherodii]|uniref:uncharacterized protein n=1 Tax=Haliotis cracherodii TaxID=6455 RepID=UPI0039EB2DD9